MHKIAFRKLTKILLLLVVVKMSLCHIEREETYEEKFLGAHPLAVPGNLQTPEDYDIYVLSIQWGNTLCLKSSVCKDKIKKIPKNILTMHGLWPSHSSGKMMPTCNTGEQIKIESDSSSIFTEMDTFWLSYSSGNESFWTHEYNKHGFCYATKYKRQDPKVFFQYALDLFTNHKLDQIFIKAFGELHGEQAFETQDLINHVQKVVPGLKFGLDCSFHDKKQYLQEIRFYFDLTLQPYDVSHYSSDCHSDKVTYIQFE